MIAFSDIELIYLLTLKELKIRYKRTFFGYVWAIANPIAFAIVYYFAFKVILRIELENYSTYLLVGIFPWMWISNSLLCTSSIFRENISIIKTTTIKPYLLVISAVMNEMVHFLFAIPVLILALWYSDQSLYLSWLWQLPVLLVFQAILIAPLGIIFATLNIVFKDIEYLVSIATTLLFFLTPIVYPISLVPDKYQVIYHINPFVYLIDAWHKAFFDGHISMSNTVFLLIYSLISFVVCYILYSRNIHKTAEYI